MNPTTYGVGTGGGTDHCGPFEGCRNGTALECMQEGCAQSKTLAGVDLPDGGQKK